MSHSLIRCKKALVRKHGAVYLKCKTSELFFVLFCLFGSFRNGLILFLHIEGLYKIGQRNLFGQVLASFVQLTGIVIGSDAGNPIALYFVSSTDIARLSQFGGVMPFDLQKSHISL